MEAWKHEPSTPPSSPSKCVRERPDPPPLRLDRLGVNPSSLVGKVLQRIVRSPRHPTITLHFADSTVFQIQVDGYHPNPYLQGVPKVSRTTRDLAVNLQSLCRTNKLGLYNNSHHLFYFLTHPGA